MTLPEPRPGGAGGAGDERRVPARWNGTVTRVEDAQGRVLRYEPGPLAPGWEGRLAVVLARRRARPRSNTDTRPAAVRAIDPPPTWMPDDPAAAATLNRARVAALRAVAARQEEAERAEAVAAAKRLALEEAQRLAADLTVAPPVPDGAPAETAAERWRWLERLTTEGPALAAAREGVGLTQRELGRLAHFSRTYVGELERPQPRQERGEGAKALAARRRLALALARYTQPTSPDTQEATA